MLTRVPGGGRADPKHEARLAGLRDLARTDPDQAKRIAAAGSAVARVNARLAGAGLSRYVGTGAAAAAEDCFDSPDCFDDCPSWIWYPWGLGFGYCGGGWYWGFGFGWGGCWPYYSSCYYPASWCYGNYWYDPWWYWCAPVVYSSVIYSEGYGGGDVVIYDDDPAPVVQEPLDEPVGEASAPPAATSPLGLPGGQALNSAAQRYLEMGDASFRAGRWGEAVQHYARAVEYAPDAGVLFLVLSDALFAAGDYHYAAYSLRRAVELDPALLDAPVDKRGFYAVPSDFDRQLAALELHVRANSDDPDARLVLAANYLFGGRPHAAAEILEGPHANHARRDTVGARILEVARARSFQPPPLPAPEAPPAQPAPDEPPAQPAPDGPPAQAAPDGTGTPVVPGG